MARIIIPADFTSRQNLFNSIKEKHDADGAQSPLIPYLASQKTDLNTVAASVAQALVHHNASNEQSMQAESQRQQRDINMNTVFARFKTEVQYLKPLYKTNLKGLADWGITVDGDSKIVYPSLFSDKAILFNTFAAKHNTYGGADSPLYPFLQEQGINMAADQAMMAQAVLDNKNFEITGKSQEKETKLRDNLDQPMVKLMRGIGDFLKKLYTTNPKKLGDWGFTVTEAPRSTKVRTTSLMIGETIVITSVSIGGTFTNTGEGDLQLYRGKTANGKQYVISAKGMMGMVKGFSTITVVNPSSSVEGNFTVVSLR